MTQPHAIGSREVPLSKLAIEISGIWENPREFTGLEDDDITKLSQSVKENRIIDPLKVQMVRHNGRSYELVIDGQRRYLAAKEVLSADAPIPVIDLSADEIELTPDNVDRLLQIALTTYQREGLSSYELSTIAERLKTKRNHTLDYIGSVIDRDASWVSKMLKARATASKKLLSQWKKGEITDEQFKELASVTEPEKQEQAVKDVIEARKGGDKTEARLRAKEIAAEAKNGKATAAAATPAASSKPAVPVAVKGPQVDMFKEPEKPKPEAPKMRSRAVLDDLLHMADKRPPTADYVKGIVDGVRYAAGILEADKFSKAWHQYMNRVTGVPRPAKKAKVKKAAKARKPAKKTKAKRK